MKKRPFAAISLILLFKEVLLVNMNQSPLCMPLSEIEDELVFATRFLEERPNNYVACARAYALRKEFDRRNEKVNSEYRLSFETIRQLIEAGRFRVIK